jgi:hypothetical protein
MASLQTIENVYGLLAKSSSCYTFHVFTQIHSAVQQVGFRRFKRGYKKPLATPIDPAAAIAEAAKEHRDPTDPYFTYQWYLVSEQATEVNRIMKWFPLSLPPPPFCCDLEWGNVFLSIRNQLNLINKQTLGLVRFE